MNRKQIALALGIMCFILTLTIVLQVRTTSNSNKVASQTFTSNDLRDQVLKWKERYGLLRVTRLRKEIGSSKTNC